jgi:hypothetical protein
MSDLAAPDAAMMAGPEALARFLRTADDAVLGGVFSTGEVTRGDVAFGPVADAPVSLSLGEREGPAAKRWEGERLHPLRLEHRQDVVRCCTRIG